MKSDAPRHLFFIVVDALRQDVLKRLYQQGRLHGGLKFLLDRGMVCENTYANGCPTQMSAPSFFTSTLPLDFGGYDRGILDRPVSLPEVFSRGGYECTGVATGAWESAMFGYNRGFHRYYHIYDLNNLVLHVINGLYRKYYQDLLAGKKDQPDRIKMIRRGFLLSCIGFLEKELAFRLSGDYPKYLYPTQYTTETLRAYKKKIISIKQAIKEGTFDVLDDDFPTITEEEIQFPRIHPFLMRLAQAICPERIVPRNEVLRYSSARTILRYFADVFGKRAKEKPQFFYMHLLDLHELRFTDAFYQYNFQPFLKRTHEDYHFDVYEASIEYVDRELGHFFDSVGSKDEKERISVALIGDHGHHYGAPCRLSLGLPDSHLADVYHISLDCACIFYDAAITPARFQEHCSLLDVPPSILDLAGLPPERSFKGQSLLGTYRPDVIFSETCGSGPCDIATKPVYLSVKKAPYRMIYREFFLTGERIRNHYELYHVDDRYDQYNLAKDSAYGKEVSALLKLAKKRIFEIRGYKVKK